MNPFLRLKAVFAVKFDNLVSQLEDYEAVLNSAILGAENSIMDGKVQIKKIQNENHSIKQRIQDLQKSMEKWKLRAQSSYETNPKIAIECVKSLEQCEKELEIRSSHLEKNMSLENSLSRDLNIVEEKLLVLKNRKNEMVTRHIGAKALNKVSTMDQKMIGDLENLFIRWENTISKTQLQTGGMTSSLELEFEKIEAEKALNEKLEKIISKK